MGYGGLSGYGGQDSGTTPRERIEAERARPFVRIFNTGEDSPRKGWEEKELQDLIASNKLWMERKWNEAERKYAAELLKEYKSGSTSPRERIEAERAQALKGFPPQLARGFASRLSSYGGQDSGTTPRERIEADRERRRRFESDL